MNKNIVIAILALSTLVFAVLNFKGSTTNNEEISDSTNRDKKEKIINKNDTGSVDWKSQMVAKDAKIKLLQKRLDEALQDGNKVTNTVYALPEKGTEEYDKLIKGEIAKAQQEANKVRRERWKERGRERIKRQFPGLFDSLNMSEDENMPEA